MVAKRILIFDSGMGGLTVARALRQTVANAELVYGADNAAFPYGDWREDALVERIVHSVEQLAEHCSPDVVVVACNTASTLALEELRQRLDMAFVGTVPAIKPAAVETVSNIIGVLATPGTVERDYTQSLIHTFAFHCKVFLHGAPRLAEMAEAKLKGAEINLEDLRAEIAPVFRERSGARTDTVVLGCTHYPLLMDELNQAAPWPVNFIDPAPAIAAQTLNVLQGTKPLGSTNSEAVSANSVVFTSRRGIGDEQLAAYSSAGFSRHEIVDIPL